MESCRPYGALSMCVGFFYNYFAPTGRLYVFKKPRRGDIIIENGIPSPVKSPVGAA